MKASETSSGGTDYGRLEITYNVISFHIDWISKSLFLN